MRTPDREHARTAGRITDITRRRLIDGLAQLQMHWSGALEEVDFLARLYDLEALPSSDRRHATAAEDIAQHTLFNADWPTDWIFYDTRFGLADGDEPLLRFLAETLHPVVRTDPVDVKQLHEFINSVLLHDEYEVVQIDTVSGAPVFGHRLIGSGVRGSMKNLIFAAAGYKPEVVLDDAINNDLRITRNEKNCLVYDRPLGAHGLTWAELAAWWSDRQNLAGKPEREIYLSLHERLDQSLGNNNAERRILRAYAQRYVQFGPHIAALIPQAYLSLDPYTASQRREPSPLSRQRMDFLLLLPHRVRVVIECDGRQHYAGRDGRADPGRYARMMADDRDLRLKGYEVYRFGGAELTDDWAAQRLLGRFFDRLHERYQQ